MAKLNKEKFSEEAIKNFAGLYKVLHKIHSRLIREGYTINDKGIFPPKDTKNNTGSDKIS
jgi:hypothetical protein